MHALTIPKSITGSEELVIMPRKEYDFMKNAMFPTYYLKRKASKRLDRRVDRAVKEFRSGKTESLESFLKREHPRLYKEYGS